MVRAAVAVVVTLAVSTQALGKTLILCQSPGRRDAVISLGDRVFHGKTLDCISGDFVADMVPCAPNGGYGLSGSTGAAALGDVVMRWQDYGNHFGPVAGVSITADRMDFAGGFMSPGANGGYKSLWSFSANRLTGAAELREEGKPSVSFACSPARRRF